MTEVIDWEIGFEVLNKEVRFVSNFNGMPASPPLAELTKYLGGRDKDKIVDNLLNDAREARELLKIELGTENEWDARSVRICFNFSDAETLLPLNWEKVFLHGSLGALHSIACGRIIKDDSTRLELQGQSGPPVAINRLHIWLQPISEGGQWLKVANLESDRLLEMLRKSTPGTSVTISEPVAPEYAADDLKGVQWLHYAGHMNEKDLFTTEDARQAEHPFLQQTDRMPQVVFANGCRATRVLGSQLSPFEHSLVYKLPRKGVKAFVGPTIEIKDTEAIQFVKEFYERILEGSTFGEAMRDAKVSTILKCPKLAKLACSYVYYGEPQYQPFPKHLPKLPTMAPLRTPPSKQSALKCYYCDTLRTPLGISKTTESDGARYMLCKKCANTSPAERSVALLNRNGYQAFEAEIQQIAQSKIRRFEPSMEFPFSGFRVASVPKETSGLSRWFLASRRSSKPTNAPFCLMVRDPFTDKDLSVEIMNCIRSARQRGEEPVIVILDVSKHPGDLVTLVTTLNAVAILLPAYRLYAPSGVSPHEWLSERFHQLPTPNEVALVADRRDTMLLLNDPITADAISQATGLQPSLVRECLDILEGTNRRIAQGLHH